GPAARKTGAAVEAPPWSTDRTPPEFVDIAAGSGTFCAISRAGGVWCGKDGLKGKTGPQGGRSISPRFHPIPIPEPVRAVAFVRETVCALTVAGQIWCWGGMDDGLGGNSYSLGELAVPARVNALAGIRELLATERNFCAIDQEFRLWCWGPGLQAQSNPKPQPSAEPRPLGLASRSRFFTVDGNLCAWDGRHRAACIRGTDHPLEIRALSELDSLFFTSPQGELQARTPEAFERACVLKNGRFACTRSHWFCAPHAETDSVKPACDDAFEVVAECFGDFHRLRGIPMPTACRRDLDPSRISTWAATFNALCAIDRSGRLLCRGEKIPRPHAWETQVTEFSSPGGFPMVEDHLDAPRKFTTFQEPIVQVSCAGSACCTLLESGKVQCHGSVEHLFEPDPAVAATSSVTLPGNHRGLQLSGRSLCLHLPDGGVRCMARGLKDFTVPGLRAQRLIRDPDASDQYFILDDRQGGTLVHLEDESTNVPEPRQADGEPPSRKWKTRPVLPGGQLRVLGTSGSEFFIGAAPDRVYAVNRFQPELLLARQRDIVEVIRRPGDKFPMYYLVDASGRLHTVELSGDGMKRESPAEYGGVLLAEPIRGAAGLHLKVAFLLRSGRMETTSEFVQNPGRGVHEWIQEWNDLHLQVSGAVRRLFARDKTLCGLMENGRVFCSGVLPLRQGADVFFPHVQLIRLPVAVTDIQLTSDSLVFQGADGQLYVLSMAPERFLPQLRADYDFTRPQIVEPARFRVASTFAPVFPGATATFGLSADGICATVGPKTIECRFWPETTWQDANWRMRGDRLHIGSPVDVTRILEVGALKVCVQGGGRRMCFGPLGADTEALLTKGLERPGYAPLMTTPAPWLPTSPLRHGSCEEAEERRCFFLGELDRPNARQVLGEFNLPPARELLAMAAGFHHICMLKTDRRIHCRGLNASGQLGAKSWRNSWSPLVS
ncbi:hypothetical protein KKC22_10270, partial [Myxococcota bacterium]|nr:hypothetical protein [Myxococcota bacterium]